jgi:hypothetical protein
MAEDIRRTVGDITPNTFVRQGIQDNSASTIIGGLAEAGLAVDAGLAKRRFTKAQDILHAQYVVGSPAADALKEDSFSDQTKLSPEDDRSLRDFQQVLDTHSGARDQGKMNFSSYQLRAERLLRIAIAKRPGLAQEFRSIAGGFVGTDVTGAESQYRYFVTDFGPLAIEFDGLAPAAGSEVTILQRRGVTWYAPGVGTPSNGVALQETDTNAARFLCDR